MGEYFEAPLSPAAAYGTIIQVASGDEVAFTDLATALSAASSGDLILVPSGTYGLTDTIPDGVIVADNAAPGFYAWSGWFWQ